MHDDLSDICEYYNGQIEREATRLERYQLERDITWRYFEEYLQPQSTILEIGAAAGAHTIELARLGHTITAVDMSKDLLDECRRRVEDAGVGSNVEFIVADGRDLSSAADSDFDAVLCMGPLYHLVAESDRTLALRQCHERLKPGGLIFSALISRFGIMGHLLKNVAHWIEDQEEVRSIIERGSDPEHKEPGGFRGYYCVYSEIAPLHESVGFQTLKVAGVEPTISADDASYNNLEGEQRKLWLDLLYEISGEQSMVASSRHLLYIGKKSGSSD